MSALYFYSLALRLGTERFNEYDDCIDKELEFI